VARAVVFIYSGMKDYLSQDLTDEFMNFRTLKNTFFIFLLLSMCMLRAQPGPPYTVHNLNELTSRPINSFKEHYYIDSTTDLHKLALLIEHEELTTIALNLRMLPAGLITYGKYLKELDINNPHHNSATDKHKAIVYDTLKNLSDLGTLLNLQTVNINGFVIDSKDPGAEPLKPAGSLKQFSFDNSVILNFPGQLSLFGLSIGRSEVKSYKTLQFTTTLKIIGFYDVIMKDLPPDLPPSIMMINLNDCDSLRSVESLSLYPALNSISIKDCKNINRFPSALTQKKLERISIELKPDYVGSFLKAIQPVDSIRILELELYPGTAGLDFKHRSYCIGTLKVEGASYGTRTQIHFKNTDSLRVKEIYLVGDLNEIPDFSKVHGLSILDMGCTMKLSKRHASSPLAEVRNLTRFTIRNCNITDLPEDFFKHNPDLEGLAIMYTNLRRLSFGNTVLNNLKFFMLHDNPELESIPPKRFYPNSYRPDLQRNNKLKEEQN
jgi:hypothetical protein